MDQHLLRSLFYWMLTISTMVCAEANRAAPDIPEGLAESPPCHNGKFKIVVWGSDGFPEKIVCQDVTNCAAKRPSEVSVREPQEFEDRVCCPGLFMDVYYDSLNKKYRCYLPYTVEKGKRWIHTSKTDLENGPRDGHGMELLCTDCSVFYPPLFEGKKCTGYKDTVCCKTPGSDVISINGKDYCIPPHSEWYKKTSHNSKERSDGNDSPVEEPSAPTKPPKKDKPTENATTRCACPTKENDGCRHSPARDFRLCMVFSLITIFFFWYGHFAGG